MLEITIYMFFFIITYSIYWAFKKNYLEWRNQYSDFDDEVVWFLFILFLHLYLLSNGFVRYDLNNLGWSDFFRIQWPDLMPFGMLVEHLREKAFYEFVQGEASHMGDIILRTTRDYLRMFFAAIPLALIVLKQSKKKWTALVITLIFGSLMPYFIGFRYVSTALVIAALSFLIAWLVLKLIRRIQPEPESGKIMNLFNTVWIVLIIVIQIVFIEGVDFPSDDGPYMIEEMRVDREVVLADGDLVLDFARIEKTPEDMRIFILVQDHIMETLPYKPHKRTMEFEYLQDGHEITTNTYYSDTMYSSTLSVRDQIYSLDGFQDVDILPLEIIKLNKAEYTVIAQELLSQVEVSEQGWHDDEAYRCYRYVYKRPLFEDYDVTFAISETFIDVAYDESKEPFDRWKYMYRHSNVETVLEKTSTYEVVEVKSYFMDLEDPELSTVTIEPLWFRFNIQIDDDNGGEPILSVMDDSGFKK